MTCRRVLFGRPVSAYMTPMSGLFFVLMFVALAAVLGVLGVGLFAMANGGEFNRKYGNRLMRARVALQGLALLLFAAAVMTASGGQ